jgi:hypothetical protein
MSPHWIRLGENWWTPSGAPTHRIYIGYCREVPEAIVSREKKDMTAQCINGAAAYLIALGETDVIVTLDICCFRRLHQIAFWYH